jgi:thiol:disulfide interchange protein DsbD
MAAVYVLGMSVTYSVIGVVVGLTGALFGGLFQNTWFLAFMAALFLTLGLGQLGVFKIQLPVSLQTRLMGTGSATSVTGIFLMGLVSGLVVSPCVGPVIAGILAFVFNGSSAVLGFFYFFCFSLGLGMLFLLIGAFSGLINYFPKAGQWTVRVNWALATLLLFASAYYGFQWFRRVGIGVHPEAPKAASVLRWHADEKTAMAESVARGKPVVMDFTAEWCEACHVIEETVFADSKVVERLRDFVLLRIDLTSETEDNEEISKRFGVQGLPSILFLDTTGRPYDRRISGVLSPAEFLEVLDDLRHASPVDY